MLRKKPFRLYKRERKKGKPLYYARYLRPDGSYTAGRSTGETSYGKAIAAAYENLQAGNVVTIPL